VPPHLSFPVSFWWIGESVHDQRSECTCLRVLYETDCDDNVVAVLLKRSSLNGNTDRRDVMTHMYILQPQRPMHRSNHTVNLIECVLQNRD